MAAIEQVYDLVVLGPALTFGWLAASPIAERLKAPAPYQETVACTTN
ncbi:MAG: hypothetical protein RR726_36615 [Pseudomonas sp.]|jgi:hypothetical protein|nr:hypothetical protein [Pseudomonas putida]